MTHSAQRMTQPPAKKGLEDLDADLREGVEKLRGPFFQAALDRALEKQHTRDLPSVKRRRALVRQAFDDASRAGKEVPRDDLHHIHSVLALCGLPHTKQALDVREYEAPRVGQSSLVVEAGKLMTANGTWEAQPLPYGSRARLLLLHLCSEAVRQQSATINIADSLTAFIREMGFEVTGGKNGSLAYFKQQINALAACRMRIGVWGNGGAATIDAKPFKAMQVWLPDNPDQQMLWPTRITFTAEFYDSLAHHALPINLQVAKAFGNSSHMLDLLFWLTYRLTTINKPLVISWDALAKQFGHTYARQRAFRENFRANIDNIAQVLPKLPVTLSEGGITLYPADPKALALPPKRQLAAKRASIKKR